MRIAGFPWKLRGRRHSVSVKLPFRRTQGFGLSVPERETVQNRPKNPPTRLEEAALCEQGGGTGRSCDTVRKEVS